MCSQTKNYKLKKKKCKRKIHFILNHWWYHVVQSHHVARRADRKFISTTGRNLVIISATLKMASSCDSYVDISHPCFHIFFPYTLILIYCRLINELALVYIIIRVSCVFTTPFFFSFLIRKAISPPHVHDDR